MPRTSDAGTELHGLATTGIVVALVAAATQTVLYLVDVYAFDRSLAVVDLEEGGLVTWASASATFSVALAAALLSFVDTSHRARLLLVALAVAFISFDDAAHVHERIARQIAYELEVAESYVALIWPTLYLPVLVAVAVLLLRMARGTRRAHRLIVAGLLALGAAVVLEVAGLALDRAGFGSDSWPREIERMVEEGIELAGWILIATGAAIHLLAVARESGSRAAEGAA